MFEPIKNARNYFILWRVAFYEKHTICWSFELYKDLDYKIFEQYFLEERATIYFKNE